jgi:hypothetical protein
MFEIQMTKKDLACHGIKYPKFLYRAKLFRIYGAVIKDRIRTKCGKIREIAKTGKIRG